MIAALLSRFTRMDAPLIRELTQHETTAVGDADSGCGDALLACCWLLFMIGDVEDSAFVWRAKNLNFDCHSYIDSVFLVPQGVIATAKFARSHGLPDLANWVEGGGLSDSEEDARGWRSGSFFAKVPSADTSVEELASWLHG